MDTKEHLIQTLEHFRKQRNAKIQEARSFDAIIRSLELELGNAAPPSEFVDPAGTSDIPSTPNVNGGLAPVRSDEFFSMTQTDAAKAYLKKVRCAISMDQLLDGMKRGGAHVGGADPKSTLYVSLMRNPNRDFVRVSEGVIGLREFYPGLGKVAKIGKKKAAKGSRKRTKKRAVPPKGSHNDSTGDESVRDEPKVHRYPRIDPAELKAVIHRILADGELHTSDAIQKALEDVLGHRIHPLSLYGSLRSHDFEQVDEKYRLRK